MSAPIFFEGGGNTEATQSKHREGLSQYCAKLKPKESRLRIVAAGGREQTFDKFKRAAGTSRANERVALLVDSEGPVNASTSIQHLQEQDGWDFAGLSNCGFPDASSHGGMVPGRPRSARGVFDGGFLPKALPGSATSIEIIRKSDLEPALKKATRGTKTKGEYHKIDHGSALLGRIDPVKVGSASPRAARFHEFLKSL